MCDEIGVHVKIARGRAGKYGSQIVVEEFLENPSAETVLKPGVVRSKDGVRPCIADEAND